MGAVSNSVSIQLSYLLEEVVHKCNKHNYHSNSAVYVAL